MTSKAAATVAVAAIAAAALAVPAGFAATNPTMQGEVLTGPAPTITSFNCDLSGTSSFSYDVAGVATGPYPGTFTASVKTTIGPQNRPTYHPIPGLMFGDVLTFDEQYTIVSALGTVHGTKSFWMPLNNPPTNGVCDTVHTPAPPGCSALFFQADTWTNYRATIETALGTSTDGGRSAVSSGGIATMCGTTTTTGSFLETFVVSTGPLLPTTTDECKNGGFADFGGVFKNQGDCVSFVTTGGKNEPGRNQP
jgi:hypothetical protein